MGKFSDELKKELEDALKEAKDKVNETVDNGAVNNVVYQYGANFRKQILDFWNNNKNNKGLLQKSLIALLIIVCCFVAYRSSMPTLSDVEKYKQTKNVAELCEIIDDTIDDKEYREVCLGGIDAVIGLGDEKGRKFLDELIIDRKTNSDIRGMLIEKRIAANKDYITDVIDKYKKEANKHTKFDEVEGLLEEMRFYGASKQTEKDVWISRMKIACSFISNTEGDKDILEYLYDSDMMAVGFDADIIKYLRDYEALMKVNPHKEADEYEKAIEQKGNERLALGKSFGNPSLKEERRLYLIDVYHKYGTDKYLQEIARLNKQDYEDVQRYFRLGNEISELQKKYDDIYSGKRTAELKSQKENICAKIKSWKTFNEGMLNTGAMGLNMNVGAFLGINWDKLIDEQPIKFKYKMAAGWAWIFECTEVEKLQLEAVIPVDKVKITRLQFHTKNKVLKEIDMDIEGSSQAIKQYLTDKYGNPKKSVSGIKWEVDKIAVTYDDSRRINIRAIEYQNELENRKW